MFLIFLSIGIYVFTNQRITPTATKINKIVIIDISILLNDAKKLLIGIARNMEIALKMK